jgi:hypothetical protein
MQDLEAFECSTQPAKSYDDPHLLAHREETGHLPWIDLLEK